MPDWIALSVGAAIFLALSHVLGYVIGMNSGEQAISAALNATVGFGAGAYIMHKRALSDRLMR